MSRLINGVPEDKYGMWCRHDKHLFVVDLTDDSEYPRTVAAEPWPCSVCTLESVIEEMKAEREAYYDDAVAEYWRG